ncbi:DNase I-like protein [Hypoxylon rubiginosum]|uniref:DNase I-like protein n=1 Tax=Hypoxylon rubiginosum TaxID=110542 RepID=A0ACC0D6M3_9PEZI|nr:DNase I-like protein [Hypoxylon rubiginosum]
MTNETSTLDVFILTFNAAKHHINIPVFARHLYNAFGQNASTLPELVVISIQEMAPMAQAFIGSYVLSPYFQRYESAVNIAAAKFVAEEERQHRPKDRPYTLVTTRNVGMTGIMMFAREPAAVRNLQATEVGFGAGDLANKGAVGLRTLYERRGADGRIIASTELTFVSAHLEAMEWNLERRNKNWESIVSGLLFEDPKKIAERPSLHPTLHDSEDSSEGQSLLRRDSTEKALHDISIYKPGSHLFVAGDLNYRLSKTAPAPGSIFPEIDPESPNYYPNFLTRDQLTAEKGANRTLHGLSEAPIEFPPTYKLDSLPKSKPQTELGRIGDEEDDVDEVKWSWARHRWPGWCDRILFLDIPWWAREDVNKDAKMKITTYDALPAVRSSDHRPVFLRLDIPMLDPDSLAPTQSAYEREQRDAGWTGFVNPRIKLPFSVDFRSWEHRAMVKKWESTIGWSMLISQSKQGIMVFITVLLVGLGAWWYRSR